VVAVADAVTRLLDGDAFCVAFN